MFRQTIDSFSKIPLLIRLIILIILLILASAAAMTYVEPATFPSLPDGIWWAIVTASTVGYGDYVPHTAIGKFIGLLLILSGTGVLTTCFAVIAAKAISLEVRFMNGTKPYTGKNHIIIIGWNERSKNIIASVQQQNPSVPIVLIDASIKKHPDSPNRFHFIHGLSIEDHVLERAGIKTASKVLVTADFHKNEHQADMYSILVLLACKGLNPQAEVSVEILTSGQVNNARRAGADHIIESNVYAGRTLTETLIPRK